MLACFQDQDARVRYYACEAMYNIAKVAKGEILVYFNHIFDALCKVRHRFMLLFMVLHPGARYSGLPSSLFLIRRSSVLTLSSR